MPLKDKRAGNKPKNRKLATTTKGKKLTANQWQNTLQQNKFLDLWTNPENTRTFSRAYLSAIEAGYTPYYAQKISNPIVGNKWLSEYVKGLSLTPKHIQAKLEEIALKEDNNSKSPADTQLKSLELLMKLHNIGDKSTTNITLVQPILSGQSVKVDSDNSTPNSTLDSNTTIIDQ